MPIQCGGGFVGQDRRGVTQKQPGKSYALLLTSGQRMDHGVLPAFESDVAQHGGDVSVPGCAGAERRHGHSEVVCHGLIVNEGEVLEQIAHVVPPEFPPPPGAQAAQRHTVNADLAGVGDIDAAEAIEECGLAAPRRPYESGQLAVWKLGADATPHGVAAKGFGQVGHGNHR